jgi:hypothetical protein
MKTALLAALLPVFLLSAERVSAHYDPGTQRWINRDPIEEKGGLNMFRFAACNPVNLFDPFGLNACDDLARDMGTFYGVGEKLDDMYRNWKPGEKWKDYGLGAVANATGGRSPSFKHLSPYTQAAINEMESNWPVNGMQAAQLTLIGGVGFYTLGLHGLFHGTSAGEQWWLTHIAIERFRNKWLQNLLQKQYDYCSRNDRFSVHISE